MNSSPKIEVRALTRNFGATQALSHASFTIAPNTICGLLGANGAGKTTLMSILAGHDRPSSGTAQIDGLHPFESEVVAANTSFIRDNQRYPDNYFLRHALRSAALFHANWDPSFADELVKIFRLPPKTQIQKYSRGQLSALAIVISLASRAPLTIFDEPYLGLDVAARHRFYELLIEDYSAHPRTVIVSTHLVGEMENILTQAIILDQGKVVVDAPVEELQNFAFEVSGPSEAVTNFVEPGDTLRRRKIGALATATARGQYELARRRAANHSGLEVRPVNLQDLVAAIGGDSPEQTTKEEAA